MSRVDPCPESREPDPTSAVAGGLDENPSCASALHNPVRRLFSCLERLTILRDIGIERSRLESDLAPLQEEHLLVKAAMDRTVQTMGLTPLQRAVLWEELTSLIQQRLGRPVSTGFRGHHRGNEIYVFQGFRRFNGKVYVLVILEDGRLLTGKVDPLGEIGAWRGRLSELQELGPKP